MSIDCGSDRNYTDSSTGIFWTTDSAYTSTGKNVPVQVKDAQSVAILNQRQVGTARLFTEAFKFKRNCYNLTVQTGETYLLRATFYIGNITAVENGFNVYVDSNLWLKAAWSNPGKDYYISFSLLHCF